jgi:hypothetical protein
MKGSNQEEHVHKEFQVHMLSEEGKAKAREIASAFDECLTKLEGLVPPGRELDLVRTKLEEACFFAKKGMAERSSEK